MYLTTVSYRANDAAGHAMRIYEELRKVYLDSSVFWGPEESGDSRVTAIRRSLTHVCVIGARWHPRSLLSSHDIVRRELDTARNYRRPVIPVFVDGATPDVIYDHLPPQFAFLKAGEPIIIPSANHNAYLSSLDSVVRQVGSIVNTLFIDRVPESVARISVHNANQAKLLEGHYRASVCLDSSPAAQTGQYAFQCPGSIDIVMPIGRHRVQALITSNMIKPHGEGSRDVTIFDQSVDGYFDYGTYKMVLVLKRRFFRKDIQSIAWEFAPEHDTE